MSQQINLLNPRLTRQRDYFSFPNMLQGLGLVVFGSLLFYSYAFYQSSQLTKQFEENTKRYNSEQARLTQFTRDFSPKQSKEELQAEVSMLEKELAEKKELVEVLRSSAGGSTAGFSEYMRAFARQIVQGVWLTGFTLSGEGVIRLSGGAVNPELLPIYIQRLGKEQIMHDKTFSALKIEAAVPLRYVTFDLSSKPDGDVKK